MAGPIEVLSKVIISQYHSTLDTEAVQAHTPVTTAGALAGRGPLRRTGEDNFRLGISVLFAPRVPRLSTILLRNYSCRTARATPYCCAAPLLSHRHADTATPNRRSPMLPPGCGRHTAAAARGRCHTTAAATLLLPHCGCYTASWIVLANVPECHTELDGRSSDRPTCTRRAAPTFPHRTPRAVPKGGSQGRRRRHPSPPCATARRGRPEAYPKGRPHPLQVTPRPLRFTCTRQLGPFMGRGSKRALTHRAGKSNRLM